MVVLSSMCMGLELTFASPPPGHRPWERRCSCPPGWGHRGPNTGPAWWAAPPENSLGKGWSEGWVGLYRDRNMSVKSSPQAHILYTHNCPSIRICGMCLSQWHFLLLCFGQQSLFIVIKTFTQNAFSLSLDLFNIFYHLSCSSYRSGLHTNA